MKKRRPCFPSVSTRWNFYLLCDFFLFNQEILQNGQNAQKWSKYNFFSPLVAKIWNFEKKVIFLKFWSISWLKMKKRRQGSPSVSTRRNFYLLCDFFLFSQEILQNGRNAFKNGRNTIFFTPSGQNMKLWNKNHLFLFLSISWLKMKKWRPCSTSISTRRNFYLLCDFFFFSQEILQNGRIASKNGQNTSFLPLVAKIWNFEIKIIFLKF